MAAGERAARCVSATMVSGTGISIKTIEALALGKPFVGTSKAYRGMPKSVFERRADVRPNVGYIRKWVEMKTLKHLLRPESPSGTRPASSRKVISAFSASSTHAGLTIFLMERLECRG
jgi:hypothetical protein